MIKKSFPLILAVLLLQVGCGPKRQEVEKMLKEARAAGLELDKDGPSNAETFNYRNLIRGAEIALEKEEFEKALNQARIARREAARVIKERKAKKKEVSREITDTMKKLNSVTSPSLPDSRDPFFRARIAFGRRDYQKAGELIQKARESLEREAHTDWEKRLALDKIPQKLKVAFWKKKKKVIPIYEKVTKDCRFRGKVLGYVRLGSEVEFIESNWVTPLERCLKIRTIKPLGGRTSVLPGKKFKPVTGWIQGHFVDKETRQNLKARQKR